MLWTCFCVGQHQNKCGMLDNNDFDITSDEVVIADDIKGIRFNSVMN